MEVLTLNPINIVLCLPVIFTYLDLLSYIILIWFLRVVSPVLQRKIGELHSSEFNSTVPEQIWYFIYLHITSSWNVVSVQERQGIKKFKVEQSSYTD